MADAEDGPFTLAFVGYADPGRAADAIAYEDAVLPLLTDHGAELLSRVRRCEGEDPVLPLEVQLIRFPSRAALQAYLADERRIALRERYGDVFTTAHVVEVDQIVEA
jgi:hypothetical protein